MASFADLSANLKINIQDFAKGLEEASRTVSSFASDINKKVGNAVTDVDKKTQAWGLNVKSVSRVVSGILISQAFYGMVQSIREATEAVWEYSKQLEYAHMVYTNLFGDADLAAELIHVMEDFAAVTPFDFTDTEAAVRRLLAYGIQYKNVMYVAQGVLSGAAVTGDPTSVERVSRAIGQIYSKGKLYQEEVRQLTEASIPAMEILREKLGLTEAQISNIGKAGIPASKAINALVEGMNERFGMVLEASSLTMQGIFSNIRDNAKMIGKVVFGPLLDKIKSIAAAFGEWLVELRAIASVSGLGGLFEHLIPEELQGTLRTFAASLMVLANSIKGLVTNAFKVFGTVLQTVVEAFNLAAPAINIIITLLSALIGWIGSSTGSIRVLTTILLACAAAWAIFKIQALGALIVEAVANAIKKVSSAISFLSNILTVSPVIALLGVLAAVGIAIALSFDKARAAIKNFTNEAMTLMGIDPDKLFIPSQEERASDLDKFSYALDDSADSMGDLGDAAASAAKKAKKAQDQLLSFDEVFKLNKEDESTDVDAGSTYTIGSGYGYGSGSGSKKKKEEEVVVDPEKVAEQADEAAKKYTEELKDKLKTYAISAGLGSVLGGVIGGMFGGPTGAKIGIAAGAVGGLIWNKIAESLELTNTAKIATPILTGLGTALAIKIGGASAGPVALGIALLASSLIDGISTGIEKGDWSKVTSPLTTGIGAAIGFAVAGVPGAVAGAGAGALIGQVLTPYTNQIVEGLYTFGGQVYDFFYDLGGKIGPVVDSALYPVFDFFYNIGGVVGPALETFGGQVYDFCYTLGQDIYQTLYNAGSSLYEVMYNFGAQAQETYAATKEAIGTWFTETALDIALWAVETDIAIDTWAANTYTAVSTWVTNVRTSFQTWKLNTLTDIATWAATAALNIATWAANTKQNIITWAGTTGTSLNTWGVRAGAVINTFSSDATTAIANFVSSAISSIASWASETISKASSAMSGFVGSIRSGLGNALSAVRNFCSQALSAIGTWASNVASTVAGALSSAWNSVSSFASSAWSGAKSTVSGWFGSGHATGGIFNREHVARFAEGNKAEAVIPLENANAMQPFVDAIATGLASSLAPVLAGAGGGNYTANEDLRPLYVGTLIADERGLKELERKMQIIRVDEERRGR